MPEPELPRPLSLDRVGGQGVSVAVEARAEELGAIAARLLIPAVLGLRCEYRVRRGEVGLVVAEGALRAQVVQDCVVSLEPFTQEVAEDFVVHFVPEGTEDEEPLPDSIDQVPYRGAVIDLGEATVEQLALALDPYPRAPGADLPAEAVDELPHPFGALAGAFKREA